MQPGVDLFWVEVTVKRHLKPKKFDCKFSGCITEARRTNKHKRTAPVLVTHPCAGKSNGYKSNDWEMLSNTSLTLPTELISYFTHFQEVSPSGCLFSNKILSLQNWIMKLTRQAKIFPDGERWTGRSSGSFFTFHLLDFFNHFELQNGQLK